MATPTKQQIEKALSICMDASADGRTNYRSMTYEDGVEAAIRWLTDDDEFPFDD